MISWALCSSYALETSILCHFMYRRCSLENWQCWRAHDLGTGWTIIDGFALFLVTSWMHCVEGFYLETEARAAHSDGCSLCRSNPHCEMHRLLPLFWDKAFMVKIEYILITDTTHICMLMIKHGVSSFTRGYLIIDICSRDLLGDHMVGDQARKPYFCLTKLALFFYYTYNCQLSNTRYLIARTICVDKLPCVRNASCKMSPHL